MAGKNNLYYIKHKDIDSEKWDNCVINSANSRIYACSWHLDRTAVTWDALIWGDYEYVMPLPIRKKMGIHYFYQPLFSQQLGIFPSPSPEVAFVFYIYLLNHFRFAELQLNSENPKTEELPGIGFHARNNLLLPLHSNYKELSVSFSTNTKRNIAKSKKNELSLVEGIRLEDYMDFKQKNRIVNIGESDLQHLKSLIAFGQYKGFGKIYGVYLPDNQLCAAVYFCRWKDRLIYFNAASNEEGKNQRAMYFLLNKFIESNAGSGLTIDFEGSMIPGVARFYRGFGAEPETYFQLKFNRLPLPFKWFKR